MSADVKKTRASRPGVFLAAVAALFLARVLSKLKRKPPETGPHCADEQPKSSCH